MNFKSGHHAWPEGADLKVSRLLANTLLFAVRLLVVCRQWKQFTRAAVRKMEVEEMNRTGQLRLLFLGIRLACPMGLIPQCQGLAADLLLGP